MTTDIGALTKRAWSVHQRHLNRARIGEPGSEGDTRFLALALCGEAGELANKIKKLWRGDNPGPTREEVAKEIGDTLNYLILLAESMNIDPVEEADKALTEYESRFLKGTQ